jgi:hypothetical protein
MDTQGFLDRFAGVLRLDRGAYEGIKRDGDAANGQALLVVVLTALLSGVGQAATLGRSLREGSAGGDPDVERFAAELAAFFEATGGRLLVIVGSVLLAVVFWYVNAAILGWVGRSLFGGDGSVTGSQVRNLVGWGYAPGLLNVLVAVPVLGAIVPLVAGIWALVTGVVAVRTAFGFSTGRAVAAWLVAALLPAVVLGCACAALAVAIASAAG